MRAGRQDAADHLVGHLGRRDVQDAADQAGFHELLHGTSAGARRVEDEAVEALGFKGLADGRHAWGRDAEHRHAQRRLFV